MCARAYTRTHPRTTLTPTKMEKYARQNSYLYPFQNTQVRETGIKLFPQCHVETLNRNREHIRQGRVGRPARSPEAKIPQTKIEMSWRIGERVSWDFGSGFSGFHCLKECVFRRTSSEDLINLRSRLHIFDKCMCAMYVMMYVVCVGRTDRWSR